MEKQENLKKARITDNPIVPIPTKPEKKGKASIQSLISPFPLLTIIMEIVSISIQITEVMIHNVSSEFEFEFPAGARHGILSQTSVMLAEVNITFKKLC